MWNVGKSATAYSDTALCVKLIRPKKPTGMPSIPSAQAMPSVLIRLMLPLWPFEMARPFGGPGRPPFPPPQGFSLPPGSFLFFSPGPPPLPKGRDFKPSKPSIQTYTIYTSDTPPIRLTGSGFFIQKDLVVTTAEVVGCMAHPIVITDAGKWVPAIGMNVDYKNNVAVLRLPKDTDVPTLDWGEDSAAPPGSLVLVFGNQAGFSQVPTLGMVTAHNLWARSPDG